MMGSVKSYAMGVMALWAGCLRGDSIVADRPNILLITTDDQGLQAGCYGDPLARTPSLDRLASEGTRFARAYVTQGSCSPSRSSILTGLYPHQNGHFGLTNNFRIYDGIETLPAILKSAGYRTGIIGKLHVNPESAFPFDFWEIRSPVQTRYVRNVNASAQKFMEASGEAPFFLMVNFFDPHRPYDDESNQCDGLPETPYTADDVRPFDFMGVNVPELRMEIAAYYNCVSRADTGIGMLLDSLEEQGLSDNTLVIFISDNGPDFTRGKTTCYEAGVHVPFIVRYPAINRFGQVRNELVSAVDIVPTILDVTGINGPDGLPGRSFLPLLRGEQPLWRKHIFAEHTAHGVIQYFPRRVALAEQYKLIYNLLSDRSVKSGGVGGVIQTFGEDGPLTDDKGLYKIRYNASAPAFYGDPAHYFGAPGDTIRQAYVTLLNPPKFELYDLEKDPHERINLADNPEYSEILKQMQADLEEWRKDTDDPFLGSAYLDEFTRKIDKMVRESQWRIPFDLPKRNN